MKKFISPPKIHIDRIFYSIILLIASLSIFSGVTVYAEDTNSAQETQTSSTHERSVQKLYAKVYDQDTNEYLGRFLLSTQVGYTDSPHRMFDEGGINPIHIDSYTFVGNPSAMLPVDWKNKSGVTEIKWTMVKTTSETYKKRQEATNHSKNTHTEKDTSNPKFNEDGLRIDDHGNPDLHDLYHTYMAFLGHPLSSDKAINYRPDYHTLYLFKKYFGYDPNKIKEENYNHSVDKHSSTNSSYVNESNYQSHSKKVHQNNIKHTSKKNNKKPKSNPNIKLSLIGLSLVLISLLVYLIVKRLRLRYE